MRLCFIGTSLLGRTLRAASEARGFEIAPKMTAADIVFLAIDVEDHAKLEEITAAMEDAMAMPTSTPIIVVSQIPPGFIRPWLARRGNIFVQTDSLIVANALECATFPKRFIIGCEDKTKPLPPVYADYLMAFHAPIVKMSIESAELSKLSVNYILTQQIELANKLSALAKTLGADWSEMIPGLRLDPRIGQAYIVPGKTNKHLSRDADTIDRLLRK